MQTPPGGWPTDLSVTTPLADVTLDGETVLSPRLESVQVRREIASTLPDQARGLSGISTGQATVVLADATPGEWSPFRTPSIVGSDCSIRLGYQRAEWDFTAPTMLPALSGLATTADGDASSGVTTVRVADESELLRVDVDVPVVIADSGPGLRPGLLPTWALDNIARRAGFASTPQNVGLAPARSLLSATLMGSAWPEWGSLSSSAHFSDSGSEPGWRESAWGVGASRLDATWAPFDSPAFTSTEATKVAWWADLTAPVSGATLDGELVTSSTYDVYINVGPLTYRVGESGSTITLYEGALSIGTIGSAAGVARMWSIRSVAAGSYEIKVTTDTGQTLTVTRSIGSTPALASVRLATQGRPVGAVQAFTYPVAQTFNAANYSTYFLAGRSDFDPSLARLAGIPPLGGVSAWGAMQQLAEAEQGAAWIDETGKLIFRNRLTLSSSGPTTPLPVTARDSIVSLGWRESTTDTARRVEVPLAIPVITTSTTGIQDVTVWALTQKVVVWGHSQAYIDVSMDGAAIGLDAFPRQGAASEFSRWRANTKADGTGLEHTLLFVSVESTGPDTARVLVRNLGALPAWMVNTAGDPYLLLRARGMVASGESMKVSVGLNDPVFGGTSPGRTLTLSDNPWRQDPSAVTDLAIWLAGQLDRPRPVIPDVQIVPNLLIQLADMIDLSDPDVTGIVQRCIVVGIDVSIRAGQLRQSLTVRPVDFVMADQDAVWAGETLGDFDTFWAGQTLADMDADPLARS